MCECAIRAPVQSIAQGRALNESWMAKKVQKVYIKYAFYFLIFFCVVPEAFYLELKCVCQTFLISDYVTFLLDIAIA